jgi:hypothetical protein
MASAHRADFVEKTIKADLTVGKPSMRTFTPVGGFASRN